MSEITLDVQGMTCGACVRHVTQALKQVPGVEDVAVDLVSGRVDVRGQWSADHTPLVRALQDAGYPASAATGPGATAFKPAPRAGGCCCG